MALYMHHMAAWEHRKLLRITYSWLCQLLDPLDFFVWDYVKVADNVGRVPLILLFDRCQHIHWVAIVVIVTTEQSALPTGGLSERKKESRKQRVETKVYFIKLEIVFLCMSLSSHHSNTFPTTKHLILLPLWDQRKASLLFGLCLLLFIRFSFPSLLLFLSFTLRSLFLLLQLELKVLQVAIGALVLWVWKSKIQDQQR